MKEEEKISYGIVVPLFAFPKKLNLETEFQEDEDELSENSFQVKEDTPKERVGNKIEKYDVEETNEGLLQVLKKGQVFANKGKLMKTGNGMKLEYIQKNSSKEDKEKETVKEGKIDKINEKKSKRVFNNAKSIQPGEIGRSCIKEKDVSFFLTNEMVNRHYYL